VQHIFLISFRLISLGEEGAAGAIWEGKGDTQETAAISIIHVRIITYTPHGTNGKKDEPRNHDDDDDDGALLLPSHLSEIKNSIDKFQTK